jgi:hypothetical protein
LSYLVLFHSFLFKESIKSGNHETFFRNMHAMPPKRHLHGHFPQDSGRYFLMHGTAAAKTPENKKTADSAM